MVFQKIKNECDGLKAEGFKGLMFNIKKKKFKVELHENNDGSSYTFLYIHKYLKITFEVRKVALF